ncbi:nicotinamide riboside kinase 1-like isoform X1 [Palaemon carinicauda]|uniref:nicotinamide riboside kinase 1-like isoform X1 n=1 Tax=Palaemon carinicauda TaxID=392227 RepID=UPI0035B5DE05
MCQWLVVSLCGVTNGGKSTLMKELLKVLPDSTKFLCQDNYFYPEDSSHHIPCPGSLKHHNWDIISAVDMEKMKLDVRNIINSTPCNSNSSIQTYRPILLLDGFLLFDDSELTAMCDLRYFITLSREQCWERRKNRNYDPPDPPGYFDLCVWPMYEEHLDRVKKTVAEVIFLDGTKWWLEAVSQQILELAKIKPTYK